tara:strand:- start:410 stop:592 length:183 start_codon:yes stop_codon:yes gene_type:complete
MKKEHLENKLIELLKKHFELENQIDQLKPKIETYAREYFHLTGEQFEYKIGMKDRRRGDL